MQTPWGDALVGSRTEIRLVSWRNWVRTSQVASLQNGPISGILTYPCTYLSHIVLGLYYQENTHKWWYITLDSSLFKNKASILTSLSISLSPSLSLLLPPSLPLSLHSCWRKEVSCLLMRSPRQPIEMSTWQGTKAYQPLCE